MNRRHLLPHVAPYPFPPNVSVEDGYGIVITDLYGDVRGFHEYVLGRYGGSSGIRSEALLRSAIERPFSSLGADLAYPTGLEQAAALLHSLVNNHPFVDANKRTAFLACLYFLERCRYWHEDVFLNRAEAFALERLVIDLARESEDLTHRRLQTPYTIEDIARQLDRILHGSRNRRLTQRRFRSGVFRRLGNLFER
ncbi:MAG: Death on curing protein, Doc toxin [Ktedonobacterales bacterium]|jgi:death-on-curing family protein|nr:MAG: Death on curing protein, Doc toxin [Ktedonobacterales bacterium]